MDLTAGDVVGICDRAGIVAFAFAGVEVGIQRRLDVFGLLVMGIVTATGGGLMRDVVLGRVPLVIDREDYLLWALGASALAIAVVAARWRLPSALLTIADAAGLGAFASAGALAAVSAGMGVLPAVLLGVLTGTGGGALRDLLAARIPLVLRSEVNASAAAAGALVVWAVEPAGAGAAALAGASVTAAIRLLSVIWRLHLPMLRVPEGDDTPG